MQHAFIEAFAFMSLLSLAVVLLKEFLLTKEFFLGPRVELSFPLIS
jgi:hypothetical protein